MGTDLYIPVLEHVLHCDLGNTPLLDLIFRIFCVAI